MKKVSWRDISLQKIFNLQLIITIISYPDSGTS